MNMDVTLDAKKVTAPAYLPVQALAFRVLINNGVATAKPLTLSLIGGGTIAGELSIDAQTDLPKVRAALKGSNIELGVSTATAFDAGLRRTFRWYLDSEDWWRALKGARARAHF